MIQTIFGEIIYIGTMDENIHNNFKNDTIQKLNNNREINYASWNTCSVNSTFFEKDEFCNSQKINYHLIEDEINKHVQKMFEMVNSNDKEIIDCIFSKQWINVYNKNDFQEVHDHISKTDNFSCVYFMQYDKLKDAKLYFDNNNYQVQNLCNTANFFKNNDNYKCVYYPDIREGTILIFPVYLKHGVCVQTNDMNPRITIAMNIGILNN